MSRRVLFVHNVAPMSFRLLPALAFSLILHACVLWGNVVSFDPPPPRLLQASLQVAARPLPPSDDPLLKNTLANQPAPPPPRPTAARPVATESATAARAAPRRQVEAAQRRLSQHLYYPPEAVARGIEGEVRLILKLSDEGSIVDVQLAASSGHAILDQAAVKAAYAMGRVNWTQSRELILPVVFRLE